MNLASILNQQLFKKIIFDYNQRPDNINFNGYGDDLESSVYHAKQNFLPFSYE